MKTARMVAITVGMALGVFALFLSWEAAAQAPADSPSGFPGYSAQTRNLAPVPFGNMLDSRTVSDPEIAKMHASEASAEREVNNLVKGYAGTSDEAQRTKIKANLSTALEKQFELQQQRRELEVARIEAQLKKLRDLMKKRGDARQTIVEKRLDQLVRDAEGLGWTPPPNSVVPQPGGGGGAIIRSGLQPR
jgi:hypothetical protein